MAKMIQLVDDSEAIRRALAHIFRAAGFDVCDDSRTASQAIVEAMFARPDLIVLDMSLPDMNGLQAAGILHRVVPESPIVLFTLYVGTVLEREARKFGVSAMISKHEPTDMVVQTAAELLHLTVEAN
jgi:DNA-binding NarL/FixJ family response regulator